MATNSIKNTIDNRLPFLTWKELYKADLNLEVPFQLQLDNGNILFCDTILRLIPKKRMVVSGRYNNQDIVAKLFYQSHKANEQIQQEIKGNEALISSGTNTPKILHHGRAQDKKIKVIIFERILNARSFDEIWQNKVSLAKTVPILNMLTLELAAQHVSGLMQHDLHFKNFLVSGKKLFTIDTGNFDFFGAPLPKKKTLNQLALFFAQMGMVPQELIEKLFNSYTKSRGWLIKSYDKEYLNKQIKKYNKIRRKSYNKKLMRSSSAFRKINLFSSVKIYDRSYFSPEFKQLLDAPEKIFTQPDVLFLKKGRSSTVIQFSLNGKEFVMKRFNIKNKWHWLRRALRSTRAANSWRLGHLLRMFGVPVAKPIAFIEARILGLRGKSYLLMENIEGNECGVYFSQTTDVNEKSKTAEAIVQLIYNLAALRITHGDLKKTNILIKNNNPVLIDLDGMIEHHTNYSSNKSLKQEVDRFMRNWEKGSPTYQMFARMLPYEVA